VYKPEFDAIVLNATGQLLLMITPKEVLGLVFTVETRLVPSVKKLVQSLMVRFTTYAALSNEFEMSLKLLPV
jgi:hypothetical protein